MEITTTKKPNQPKKYKTKKYFSYISLFKIDDNFDYETLKNAYEKIKNDSTNTHDIINLDEIYQFLLNFVRIKTPLKKDNSINNEEDIELLNENFDSNDVDYDIEDIEEKSNKKSKKEFDEMGNEFNEKYSILKLKKDCYFKYGETHWEKVTLDDLMDLAINCDEPSKTNSHRRKETVLYALTKRKTKKIPWNRKLTIYSIPFLNGILDIKSGEIESHIKENYINYVFPFNYNPNAECPIWIRCLNDWFGNDNNKKLLLQEFFGYVFASHSNWKKSLWLLGANDTGKSKVVEVLAKLVGEENYSTVSMDSMDDPRKISEIFGKRVNLVFDEKTGCSLAAGGFKKLISCEPMTIDIKYEVNGPYRPNLKHIAAMNELPKMTDSTNAIITRVILIKFTNKLKQFDEELMNKLELEMEGIVKWAVEGLKRRTIIGKWTELSESSQLLHEYKIRENSVLDFIENSGLVVRDEFGEITCKEFSRLYNLCNSDDLSPNKIGIRMSRLEFVSKHNGKERVYVGLKKIEPNIKSKESLQIVPNF